MSKAATILLLVGAILSAVGAFFFLLMVAFIGAIFSGLPTEGTGFPFGFIAGFYGVIGILVAAGSVCAFVGWRKASQGDFQGGFVWGLIGALLPPVQIVTLVGAILAKVCPEAEAQARPQAPPQVR
jgi:hypothetical protein